MGLTTSGVTAAGNSEGIFGSRVPITVGSSTLADRNVVSGNAFTGILLSNAGASGSVIMGNLIGTDKTTILNLGTGGIGINLGPSVTSTTIGIAAAPNLIAHNRIGIEVMIGLNNRLNFNRFVSNDQLGIDLVGQPGNIQGVSLNDNFDLDDGGNGQQNFLDDGFTAQRTASGLQIQGTLRRPATGTITFVITAYATASCDSSGHGEGELLLGTATSPSSSGAAGTGSTPINLAIPLASQPPFGSFITTTVTTPSGSTSEFSSCAALDPPPLVVNSTNDVADGSCNAAHCSLRDAIIVANATPVGDVINFAINPAVTTGELLIQPLSPLPSITAPVLIDGYSQSGTAVNTDPKVSNAVLRIRISGGNAGASTSGLAVCANDVTIRGLSLTNFTQKGIQIGARSDGAVCPSAVISGNVVGNFIGLASDGITPEGNTDDGINSTRSTLTIGSNNPKDRNVISSNGDAGIAFSNARQAPAIVLGNLIGTDKAGVLNRGNGVAIALSFGVDKIVIGTSTAPNLIRFNGRGISTLNSAASENSWIHNRIFDSANIGIDLNANGVTPNDLNDADTGPNGLQNFPVITRAERTAAGIQISGALDVPSALSATNYTIGVYANSACDASGHGEGERLLGAAVVQLTGGSENFSFSLNTDDALEAGVQITSTATGPEGSSEFSACVPASDALPGIAVDSLLDIGPNALGCDVPDDSNECTLREAITLANSNSDVSQIRFAIPGNAPLTIAVATLLPAITAPLSIDGYSQPGASENAASIGSDANVGIQLRNGSSVIFGLMICASDVSIRGLSITQFSSAGIATQMNASASCSVQGSNVRISGNFIGLLANGVPFPNGHGVLAANTQVLIGGPALADRNLISSNNLQGVHIAGAASSGSVVQNNLIGTGLLPGTNRGNGGTGVVINDASDVIVGGSGILANTMSFNASGIVVTGTGTGNQLAANDYAANTGPGIDLAGFGITPNDINDVDSGPNNLQNFPVLTDASASASSITVNGILDVPAATNNAPYLITLYESDSCDSSGNGEGSLRLAATSVNFSAAAENFSITLKVPPNNASSVITATATDALGNTSEFSSCIAAPQLNAIFANGFE